MWLQVALLKQWQIWLQFWPYLFSWHAAGEQSRQEWWELQQPGSYQPSPRAGRGSVSGGWLLCEGVLWCHREIMCPTGLTFEHRHCNHHLFGSTFAGCPSPRCIQPQHAQAEPPSLNPN